MFFASWLRSRKSGPRPRRHPARRLRGPTANLLLERLEERSLLSTFVGDNAVLKIVLDGSLAGAVNGLVIGGGNSTVRGLVIDNFAADYGIEIGGSGNHVVVGNFIGTDVTGVSAAANSYGIVILLSSPG